MASCQQAPSPRPMLTAPPSSHRLHSGILPIRSRWPTRKGKKKKKRNCMSYVLFIHIHIYYLHKREKKRKEKRKEGNHYIYNYNTKRVPKPPLRRRPGRRWPFLRGWPAPPPRPLCPTAAHCPPRSGSAKAPSSSHCPRELCHCSLPQHPPAPRFSPRSWPRPCTVRAFSPPVCCPR